MNGINLIKRNYPYILIYITLIPILWFRSFTSANELRYLEIANEALKSGTFFSFSYHGVPYADKPPLYLWIVMLCKWLFGGHYMGILTFFSIIPAFIIAYIMYKWSQSEISEDTKHIGNLMLLTCGLFLGAGIVVRMDMLMTLFIVLALRCFYDRAVNGNNSIKQQILFPIYLFFAVFCKGPFGIVIPLVATLSYLVTMRKVSSFFKYWDWKTFLILMTTCAVWFCAVYVEGGGDYLYNLLFHQTFGRAYHSFHHSRPFYYYLEAVSYSLLPWTLLIITTHIKGLWGKKMSNLQKFYLSVSASIFILLSIISSKLAVYMLPMCPFLIYFTVIELSKSKWDPWYAMSISIPAIALFLSVPALIVLISHVGSLNYWPFYSMATILTGTGAYAMYFIFRHRLVDAVLIITIGLFIGIFVGGLGIEKINYLI